MAKNNKKSPKSPDGRADKEGAFKESAAGKRHAESIAVQRKIADASSAIKWATWVYAGSALAMLIWGIVDKIYF